MIKNWVKSGINLNKIIIIILGLIFAYLVFCYFYFDTLGVYDAAGQLAAVDHAKSIWPLWCGWSSRELLGWPQGLIYPPAVHWIMAGLAIIVGSPAAVKIVVAISLISLPFAMYWYFKKANIPKPWRLFLLTILTIIFIVLPDYMGSSISSLFYVGLIPNFVVLPVFFVFIGLIEGLVKKINLKYLILAGLLLGIILWSHIIIAIVAILYIGILTIKSLILRQWKVFGCFMAVGLIGLLLSLPFLTGMYLAIKGQLSSSGGLPSLLMVNTVILLMSVTVLIYLWKKKEGLGLGPILMSLLISTLCVADGALVYKFGTSFILGWIHIYRLQVFAYIFFVIAFTQVLSRLAVSKKVNVPALASIASVVCLLLALVVKNPADFNYVKVDIFAGGVIKGRFLEDFRRTESYPAPYSFQTKILQTNLNASWAHGLFAESAPNSSFVKSLSKSLRPEAYEINISDNSIDSVVVPPSRIPTLLNLFAIDNIISLNDIPDGAIGTWSQGSIKKYYHQNMLSTKKLAEVSTLTLRPVFNNWDKEVSDWWREAGDISDIPYDASEGALADLSINQAVEVEVKQWLDNKIVIDIHSDKPAPVIIKTTYAKGWKAKAVDGSNQKIWRIAPQLILIQANNEIELSYN
ncbi:MAG: hypothetical protein WCQ49_02925 [Candidatus Saccharibacteria bacterium]